LSLSLAVIAGTLSLLPGQVENGLPTFAFEAGRSSSLLLDELVLFSATSFAIFSAARETWYLTAIAGGIALLIGIPVWLYSIFDGAQAGGGTVQVYPQTDLIVLWGAAATLGTIVSLAIQQSAEKARLNRKVAPDQVR
jgi:hypothetical protein